MDSKSKTRKCPLSVKNAPPIDYKNVSLLRKYIYLKMAKSFHLSLHQCLLVTKESFQKKLKKQKF